MKFFKYTLITLLILVGIFGLFLLYATIDNYDPEEITIIEKNETPEIFTQDTFSVMIWNIGYCGMDKTIDFFYDGGTQSRVSKKRTEKNLEDIMSYLDKKNKSTDFILLQEVDKKAKRSYKINQLEKIQTQFPESHHYYGKNYDVFYIPAPILKPYGTVNAGLLNITKKQPQKVIRYQYPGNYSFPLSLFMLDRCFLEMRMQLPNSKELLIINLHNSAFDDGSLRSQQIEYLKKYMTSEYAKGNYLVIAGDWNQSPPDFVPQYTNEHIDDTTTNSFIDKNFLPEGWKYAYDATIPTNRRSNIVYDKKTTPTTLIDFFVVSPNINIISTTGENLDFANSDHNPVSATFSINKK